MAAPLEADAAVPPALRDAVLAWFDANGRALAFRATRDPYAVLVSELMAQQTQAERAAEAWTRWMAQFPTVAALAGAPVAEVIRAWAGLGYNRRAINLHRAAKAIVAEHDGRVPDTVDGLMTLPGVGPYTARAVAAIAFGVPVGAVDTNVRRVLGRVAAGAADALTAAEIQALADAVVPEGRPGDWTHALMDVGAMLCRPRSPLCAACPALAWCGFAAGERASPTPAVARVAVRAPEPAFRVNDPLAARPDRRPSPGRRRRRLGRVRHPDRRSRPARRPRGGRGARLGRPARGTGRERRPGGTPAEVGRRSPRSPHGTL